MNSPPEVASGGRCGNNYPATVTQQVATFEQRPCESLTWYVKVSDPQYPALGVYVILPVLESTFTVP